MNILLKLYSSIILCWDLAYLIFSCSWAIIESIYQTFKPPKEKCIKGEVVLIVGASRGIGRELAIQLASHGAQVVCWDINKEGNEDTVIKASQYNLAHGYHCDVSNRDEVLKTCERVKKDVGDVTMIFHCCGIPSPQSLTAAPFPGIRKIMDVGLMSHFWVLEAFLPAMLAMKHGHIVALTSVTGLTGIRDQVPICVSQFGVQGIIEALSEELRAMKHTEIHITLAHIYPLMLSKESKDIRLRIPSYFGTIDPIEAASQIIRGVRRNYMDLSIPKYMLCLGNLLKILPRKASIMIRELLDTGVDFC